MKLVVSSDVRVLVHLDFGYGFRLIYLIGGCAC